MPFLCASFCRVLCFRRSEARVAQPARVCMFSSELGIAPHPQIFTLLIRNRQTSITISITHDRNHYSISHYVPEWILNTLRVSTSRLAPATTSHHYPDTAPLTRRRRSMHRHSSMPRCAAAAGIASVAVCSSGCSCAGARSCAASDVCAGRDRVSSIGGTCCARAGSKIYGMGLSPRRPGRERAMQ